jgi:serine/threonine-protein kinase RIO1
LKESSTKKYYVVGVIGSGNTSKVFHAVDLDGEEYAIKMYVQRFNGNTYLKKDDSLGRVRHFSSIEKTKSYDVSG